MVPWVSRFDKAASRRKVYEWLEVRAKKGKVEAVSWKKDWKKEVERIVDQIQLLQPVW